MNKQHIIIEEEYDLSNEKFSYLPKMTRTYTLTEDFFKAHKGEIIKVKLLYEVILPSK